MKMLKLMYITNNPQIAAIAEETGVDIVFVDLEYMGKKERQHGMNTVVSNHKESDIEPIAQILNKSEVLVRVNPINDDSFREINSVILKGAQKIMLPMFKTPEEVKTFIEIVDGKAVTVLLLEHIDAVRCLDDILQIQGIDEIHIGLNDLHLSMQMDFMFEPFANGMVENIVKKIKEKDIPFGIGGIARLGQGLLPSDIIIAEHYRLGSSAAILSRTFCDLKKVKTYHEVKALFEQGVKDIRKYEETLLKKDNDFFEKNKELMDDKINEIVNKKGLGTE
ncbi:aldolase/citrate lyase family protein [Gallibacter sp. Marseille-QA0791]|uniref:aldolase/citrate lyase family protein n=1 Tax=Gallibacter sp. Marseille-QA0791 TaxID=3378781 RepID=UPI003D0E61F8